MSANITTAAPSPAPAREWPYDASTPVPPRAFAGRALLLAAADSPESEAATRIAAAIADFRGASVEALTVMDTRSAAIPPPVDLAIGITDDVIGPTIHREQEDAFRRRISATLGRQVAWPVRFKLGTPASIITREARDVHAGLVVMGLRRHGLLERAVIDETTLEVMRHSQCPVLGVATGCTELPRRVLVAVDFSRSSVRAALAARELLPVGGTLTLVYVHPMLLQLEDDGEAVIHRLGLDAAFAKLSSQVAGSDITVDHVVLHHQRASSIATLLLDYASDARVDLIAAGSSRHGRLDRLLLGSVSTDLVRDGRISMLIVPPADP